MKILVSLIVFLFANNAFAFCGFYVGKADSKLYNKASKVIIARNDDKNVITMAFDYSGALNEFALVIPVPTIVKKNQVNVSENALVEHVDAYTAPRLVEYFDSNPCQPIQKMAFAMRSSGVAESDSVASAKNLGVKIEEQYTVGEYDIIVLSAKESDGLEKWLKQSGYKIPDGASKVLGSYIKQDMKFFVAKVNLKEQQKLGYSYLRPLQVAYEHGKFMLPVRLGTVNSDGNQEIIIFTLTKNGRVEPVNYKTVRIPTDVQLPLFVKAKDEFTTFYKKMFDTLLAKEGMRNIFLEYAWDMSWCDPCAADPIPNDKLISLGAFWLLENSSGDAVIQNNNGAMFFPPINNPANVFITRMHARYNAKAFPEDIIFQETSDKTNFQGRYILNNPFKSTKNSDLACEAGRNYIKTILPERFKKEAENYASLTNSDITEVKRKMEESGQSFTIPEIKIEPQKPWYEQIWQK
jgi:hypothetical protein